MLKSLRKYKQILLVVGGSMLMVAFLLPDAITRLSGDPKDRVVAKLGGRTLRFRDTNLADREFGALTRMSQSLAQLGVFDEPLMPPMESGVHWLLAVYEADDAGLVGEDADGRALQDELAASAVRTFTMQMQFSPDFQNFSEAERTQRIAAATTNAQELVGRILRSAQVDAHMTDPEFHRALSKLRGVRRFREAWNGGPRLSEPRARLAANSELDTMIADVVIVPPDSLVTETPEPTPEQITAHFERFKAIKPGEGEYGIGYALEPRVKVEWLALEKSAIAAAYTPDAIEVSERYHANRTTYTKPFSEERTRIEEAMRAEKVTQVLTEADRVVRAELLRASRKLAVDGKYKVLPADWATTRPKLEDIAGKVVEAVESAFKLKIPRPTVVLRSAQWLNRSDLEQLGEISTGQLQVGLRRMPFPDLVLNVREIAGDLDPTLQAGMVFDQAITSADGSRFFVQVLEARKASPPESVDDVRGGKALLAADARRLAAFERLKTDAPRIREMAVQAGLEEVAKAYSPVAPVGTPLEPASRKVEVQRLISLSRDRVLNNLPGLDIKEFRDAAFAAGGVLDPLKLPNEADTDRLTVSVPLPSKMSLGVARIVARRPLTSDQFLTRSRGRAEGFLRAELMALREQIASAPNAFALPAMRERMKFEWTSRIDRDEEATTPSSPEGAGTATKTGEAPKAP